MEAEDSIYKNNFVDTNQQNNEVNMETLKEEVKKLSYEEALKALEAILVNVQEENISLDRIKTNYIKGHILLSHCEELLEFVEQEINQINPENINRD
tara:strand:- start:992 stop:1282 length:291 start_codon:yes stop_codon:yes gene_type:complete